MTAQVTIKSHILIPKLAYTDYDGNSAILAMYSTFEECIEAHALGDSVPSVDDFVFDFRLAN